MTANAHAKAWNSQGRLVIGYLPGPDLPVDPDSVCIREAVEATFTDTCQIGTSTISHDTYGTETIVYGAVIACRFSSDTAKETEGAQADVSACAVRVALSQLAAVATTSHVRILSRYGVTLPTPHDYRVVGQPQMGPGAITLDLQRLPSGGVG